MMMRRSIKTRSGSGKLLNTEGTKDVGTVCNVMIVTVM